MSVCRCRGERREAVCPVGLSFGMWTRNLPSGTGASFSSWPPGLTRALTFFSHHFPSEGWFRSERRPDEYQTLQWLPGSPPRSAANMCRFWGSTGSTRDFQCNHPVHVELFSNLGFYWFHLLYTFQKFLCVLVCWGSSSWLLELLWILHAFMFSRFKGILRGWREVRACAQAAILITVPLWVISPRRLHIKMSLEALKIHSHWFTAGEAAPGDWESGQGWLFSGFPEDPDVQFNAGFGNHWVMAPQNENVC